jgi:hypothetical protein
MLCVDCDRVAATVSFVFVVQRSALATAAVGVVAARDRIEGCGVGACVLTTPLLRCTRAAATSPVPRDWYLPLRRRDVTLLGPQAVEVRRK